tara:strand:+ start:47 stop:298 length:252 start_codon:yes stop_codon:yes gene_type:complete
MAWSNKVSMGEFMPKTEDYKNMRWCINNGIKISPFASSTFEWFIDIEINKRVNRSPEIYKKVVIWEKIFEFYKYYYNKHENKI